MAGTSEVLKWQRFFVAAGIPGKVASQYSKSFVDQRIQFSTLGDIDKQTLIELGVNTVGDQLAILRRIRTQKQNGDDTMDCTVAASVPSTTTTARERITVPSSETNVKRGKPAPDRDDIYHIRMPAGITPKTKEIMKKHDMLRSFGLLKRGSDGVRQSGKEVRPVSKQKVIARVSGKIVSSNFGNDASEVSSTTNEVYERLGVRGLVSDAMVRPKPNNGASRFGIGRRKEMASSSNTLFERAIRETAEEQMAEPVFRVRLRENVDDGIRPGPSGRFSKNSIYDRIRVAPSGSIRKRTPIQTRLSVAAGNRVFKKSSFKKQPRISIFDRLG